MACHGEMRMFDGKPKQFCWFCRHRDNARSGWHSRLQSLTIRLEKIYRCCPACAKMAPVPKDIVRKLKKLGKKTDYRARVLRGMSVSEI